MRFLRVPVSVFIYFVYFLLLLGQTNVTDCLESISRIKNTKKRSLEDGQRSGTVFICGTRTMCVIRIGYFNLIQINEINYANKYDNTRCN